MGVDLCWDHLLGAALAPSWGALRLPWWQKGAGRAAEAAHSRADGRQDAQGGNGTGRMDSVISHSGDTRRNARPLMGKGRQRRADRTASFPLDGSLLGGKEAPVFRRVKKSRGSGGVWRENSAVAPASHPPGPSAPSPGQPESAMQPTSRWGHTAALGSRARSPPPPRVPFLCDSLLMALCIFMSRALSPFG